MSILTIDLDTADEIDALYAIHKLNELLQSDHITTALTQAAWDIAGDTIISPDGTDNLQHSAADRIYPQVGGSTTWHQANAKASAHLRRFGMLRERIAA